MECDWDVAEVRGREREAEMLSLGTFILPEEVVSRAHLNTLILSLNSNPQASKYEPHIELCYYR
jgi:hypothetical protein